MKKHYTPPVFRYLDFMREPEPPSCSPQAELQLQSARKV